MKLKRHRTSPPIRDLADGYQRQADVTKAGLESGATAQAFARLSPERRAFYLAAMTDLIEQLQRAHCEMSAVDASLREP